ncbi:Signal transduction histidine kinase [Roseivivax lentus]|uniref:histidine kinase n=1 Tax=Roseivivax lentus TaxID=633194 RepID=A0A1N7NXR2_9RHOB|nr:ATP-binding protein [Roseivivax lentus]SIT03071.1 Signal transduction histidine kinase [Roseivivax lentus]
MPSRSIRFRLTAVILAGSAIIALLFEIAWLPRLNDLLVEAQSREAQREVQILADGIAPYLLSNQLGAIHETLGTVEARYDNWSALTLETPGGRRLYPFVAPPPLTAPDIIVETVPVTANGETLGRLTAAIDLGPEIQRFQGAQRRMILLGAGIVALILGAVIYIIDRLLTRRLVQVARAADAMALGNFDVKLPDGADEVGALARSFGAMRAQIEDQTARLEQARARSERALEARSRFVATMSHEIRTPLNGIVPVAEMLRDTELTAEQRQKVDTIVKSSNALSSIVNDILDVSMLESVKLTIAPRRMSPAALVGEALDIVRPAAEAKGLALVNRFNAPVDLVCNGDEDRLRQILINLLGNAVKFTETGAVTLGGGATRQADGTVRLEVEVRDTGIGIPKEALSRIFDRFEQVDDTSMRRFGGTGLGLSIVRGLTAAMDGEVTVDSAPGAGSRFKVRLTLAPPDAPLPDTGQDPLAAARGHPPTSVLVVDDNEINRTVAAAMLGKLGHGVDLAEDGHRAVSKADARKYDVILMDMHMPDLDGLEATRAIRQGSGPNAATWIIALTASVQSSDVEKCRDAGMDDFMAKPLTIQTLAQAFDTRATSGPGHSGAEMPAPSPSEA